jgi:PAS domain S-box-containing protein
VNVAPNRPETEHEALRHAAAILDSADDAVIGKTMDGTIVSWNAAAQRMYGYTPEEAIGRNVSMLVPPDRPNDVLQILERLRAGERVEHYETMRMAKDGRRLWVSLTISPIRDESDRIIGASAIARDITERRKLEQERRELLEGEQEARSRAEQAEARLDFLVRLSAAAGSSLDYRQALDSLAGILVESMADICTIDLVVSGELERVSVVHREPAMQKMAERIREFPADLQRDSVIPRVLRTGVAEVQSFLSEDEMAGMDRLDERRELFRALGLVSRMCVPLVARGHVIGAVMLLSTNPDRHYTQDDLDLVTGLADRIALAVDNARLHQETERAVVLKDESLSLLDTLLASAPVGLAFVDRDFRYVRINETLAALNGARPEEHLGRTVREMVPTLADFIEPLYHRVLETGEPILDVEMSGTRPGRPDSEGTWVASYYPVKGADGQVIGVGAAVVDITERKHTEDELRGIRQELTDQLEDATKLLQLSGRLSVSLDLQSVLDEVLASVVALQGADTGVLRLHEPETDELVVAASLGVGEEYLEILGRVPARAGVWGRAFAEGRPFISEDVETDPAFEGFRQAARAGGYRAVYTSPLITRRGEIIGTLATHFREPRKPSDRELRLIELYALEASDVIDNARLYREAKLTQERLEFLSEASRILSGSLDYNRTLRHLTQLVVPRLADWCSIDVKEEDGTIRQVGVAHADPEKVKWALELQKKYPPDPDAPTGAPNVIRTGQAELLPEVPEELIEAAIGDDEELRRIVDEIGFYSVMVVPLTARGRTLGALSMITTKESGKRYGPRDLAFAEELARRAGQGVDNARLYSEQRHIARTLQSSLLPPELPAIGGVEVAAVYRAAGEGTEVGGDFYDVFETSRDEWAMVMGDVCGKGPEAAAVTGLARYTIRAAAMREQDPSSILAILNDAIRRQRSDMRFATVAYARMVRRNGVVEVEVACGGHPLPLVLRKDGTVQSVGRPGTLLGIFEDAELADDHATLEPGDAFVLYTDGISQERAPGGGLTEQDLGERLAKTAGLPPDEIAERLVATTAGEDPSETRDDVAVLVLRVGP